MTNNLHPLVPISDSALEQIQQEASRTIKQHLAARRVVDVAGPFGCEFASVTVDLYVQETSTFAGYTSEASVLLSR